MKTLAYFSAFFLILLTGMLHAQSLQCEWAKSAGGAHNTYSRSVAIDPSGNSFITGTFTGPNLTIGSTTLTNAGRENIFLAKYDGVGNVLWAKSCRGNNSGINNDNAYNVASDHSGNAIIAGYYESSSFIIGTDTLSSSFSAGFQHTLVAKFDPSGNLLWAAHAQQGNAACLAMAVDPSDNIYAAGLFNCGYIVFGADTLRDTSNFPFGNLFLVKYNSSGNVLWAICGSGKNQNAFTSLATDPYGNLYATGFITDSVFTLGSYVLNNPGGRREITAKIRADGQVIWAKLSSSLYTGGSSSITTDIAGNPYITGGFEGDSIVFGSKTVYNHAYVDTLRNAAMYVVKFDTAGNPLWAKGEGYSVSGYESVNGAGIVTDAASYVYVTGNFHGNPILIYGADTLHADTADYGSNLFVAAYDGSGNLMWAKSPTGNGSYSSSSVAINDSGMLFVTGMYEYAAINFGTESLPSGDSVDAFIVKLPSPAKAVVESLPAGTDKIKVYPVPAGDLLKISLPGSGYSAVNIYDLSGRKLLEQICNPFGNNIEYVLDVGKFVPGMYVVQAIQNGLKLSRTIVIERR